jgi:hypothetical protein
MQTATQIQLDSAFVRKLEITFPVAMSAVTYDDVANLSASIGRGAIQNALRGFSNNPAAVEAGILAIRLKRNELNRFLFQFPAEIGGENNEAEPHEYQP